MLQVVELMELGPLTGALVGSPGQSGLSVEARKRLTIGVELCANPSVIFMDEPTSGTGSPVALPRVWHLFDLVADTVRHAGRYIDSFVLDVV